MRIGIVGTGRIANRFVPEAATVEGAQVTCVYNPHEESAQSFAEHYGLMAFGGTNAPDALQKFFDAVELVYIASPHGTHYDYAKQALLRGRHVLCEKPMCFEKAQAKELFALAKEKKVVLLEGLKTAYCPGFAQVLHVAQSGDIGEIRNIEACFTKLVDETGRELSDSRFGGSFPELGSYCMLPAFRIFGTDYESLSFSSVCSANGTDIFTKAFFKYPGGLATATCGLGVKSEGQLLICGTKGYVRVEAPWWKTTAFSVCHENPADVVRYSAEYAGDGLRYELMTLQEMIRGDRISEQRLAERESEAMANVMEHFLQERNKH